MIQRMELREIARIRLEQIEMGAVEAATEAGIERTFIRDLVEGKKSTVRSDKLPDLARALKLDAQALARGELVPVREKDTASEEVLRIMARLPEAKRNELLGAARILDLEHPEPEPNPIRSSSSDGEGDAG